MTTNRLECFSTDKDLPQWEPRRSLLSVALGLATLFLTSCSIPDGRVEDPPYYGKSGSWILNERVKDPRDDSPPVRRNTETNRYIVTEFKENGEPWNTAQIDTAVREIRRFRPTTVLLYVHGWHNDASEYSRRKGGDMHDIDDFLHMIEDVGKDIPTTHGGQRKTLAIYVGWRGEIRRDIARWFTLEDRRKVARDIGKSPYFQDFLARIAREGKKANANTVFVGHSLGAALVENAARNLIVSSRPESHLPHLFLLANSAEISTVSEHNLRAINTSDRVTKQLKGFDLLTPKVIAITGLGDSANKTINPINSAILLGKPGQKTLGFDSRLLTHRLAQAKSEERRITDQEAIGKNQFLLSLRPTLDPAFWAPDKNDTVLQRYRIVPKANRSDSPGFWNIQIPEKVSGGHNDVYNTRLLAASVSLLQIANPRISRLPDNMSELLEELREKLKDSVISDEKDKEHRSTRFQLVNGAALRMPDNPQSIRLMLQQLDSPTGIRDDGSRLPYLYRVNLFAILKFTHRDINGWTGENLAYLRELMVRSELQKALQSSGKFKESGARETDPNVIAFKQFLRANDIRVVR